MCEHVRRQVGGSRKYQMCTETVPDSKGKEIDRQSLYIASASGVSGDHGDHTSPAASKHWDIDLTTRMGTEFARFRR